METERPSRAISAGLRKMPVPIMVPTTMAAEAHGPRPRTSSNRFSLIALRGKDSAECTLSRFTRLGRRCGLFRPRAAGDGANQKSHTRTEEDKPGKRDRREVKDK